jgi:RHS repeat-associated protein
VVKGTVPVNSVSVDPATNRMQGWTYDANGNVTWTSETSWITYDGSNRIQSMQFPVAESYEYDPSNKRIWKTTSGGEVFTFWGGRGERIGRYVPEVQQRTVEGVVTYKFVWVKQGWEDVYFGGKRLQATDRLGSVGGGGRYYPYGEERSATAEGTDKFATYHRDGTGFDYADQRYYSAKFGRFLTSDPYVASGGPAAPKSWNRYAYVEGDPVNYLDPRGLQECAAGDPYCVDVKDTPDPIATLEVYYQYYRYLATTTGPQGINNSGIDGRNVMNSARALQRLVREGVLNDCEALAQYADESALHHEARRIGSSTSTAFVIDFGVFVPSNDRSVQLARSLGVDIFSVNGHVTLLQDDLGFASGYMARFRDSLNPGADQGHHFAAYFILGFQLAGLPGGDMAARIAGFLNDIRNEGDRNLAYEAVSVGADLRSGKIGVSAVAGRIRRLCL